LIDREIEWHQKIAETQGIHGTIAVPDKSMYHFCLRRKLARTSFSRRGLFEEFKLFQNWMMHLN